VSVDGGAIGEVTINGRVVVRDGRLLTADIQQIRAEAAAEAPRLWKRMKGMA
jgi:hypothetical protein